MKSSEELRSELATWMERMGVFAPVSAEFADRIIEIAVVRSMEGARNDTNNQG